MTTPYLRKTKRHAAILSIALLAGAPLAWSQDSWNPVLNATLVFRDGTSHRLGIEDNLISIDTIAGRLKLHARDIATVSVAESGDKAVTTLANGERWSVGAGKLATALLGEQATMTLDAVNRVIRSISLTGASTPHSSAYHGYKILFKDESTAIINPATVALPVQLESGKDEIPLGTVSAIKFAIPDGQEFPDSIFLRLKSGHVYQLPWALRKRSFSCENMSGSKLTIAYTDILGILPVASDMSRESGDAPKQQLRLEQADGTATSSSAPLQILAFNTPFGRVSLPSTFVASFTIPQGWRGQGTINTIYGDSFKGRPDFKWLLHDHNGPPQVVAVKSLLQVAQEPVRAQLPLPYAASVFSLSDGGILAGVPYAPGTLVETTEGEAIFPENSSSVTRTINSRWVYTPSRGAPILCKPLSTKVEISLIASGQKIELAWEQIEKIKFSSSIRTTESNQKSGMIIPDPEAVVPSVVLDQLVEQPAPTPGTQSDDSRPEPPSSPLFGWLRGRTSESAGEPTSTAMSLKLPWGKIDLQNDQISTIHQMEDDVTSVITTTNGDVIVTASTSWREAGLPESITNRVVTNAMAATFTLPTYVRQAGNAVRIRMMRGDIITGTFAADHIPFAPVDKHAPRDRVAVDTLRKIIRTGNDTFLYDTGRGSLAGKPTRDQVAFKPAASQSILEIALRDIEAIMAGDGPLPPPLTPSASLPPALCGLIHIPGGTFVQGGGDTGMTDETPKITVTLSPFLLDATEVTYAQFATFVRDSGYETTAEITGATTTWMNPGFPQQPDDPVVCVSWNDAAEFCNWRSRKSSLQPVYKLNRDGSITTDRAANGYRLPTESEWEFAAGGMRKTAYPWGNTFASATESAPQANFMPRDGEKDDSWRWTNPVKAFPPDPNGLYGMAGNAWEWCEDWYFNRAYDALKNRSPLNPCIQQADVPGLTHRVMRGGSYRNTPDLLRTASRGSGLAHAYAPHVGFRCARNVN